MFGMGGTEILLVGIVALIVVGPKELPGLFRSVGQFVGKARGMAREFSRAMEEAADESGMKEATNGLKGLSNPKKYGLDKVKDAANPLKWDSGSQGGKLAEDRAEAARKIQDATARAAQTRLDREAAEAATTDITTGQAAQGRPTGAAGATSPGGTGGNGLAVPELPATGTPSGQPVTARPAPAAAPGPAHPDQGAAEAQGPRRTPGQRAAGAARKPAQRPGRTRVPTKGPAGRLPRSRG